MRSTLHPTLILLCCLGALGCPEQAPPDPPGDDDTTPADDEPRISGVTWRLHETIESLVYVSWTQEVPAAAHVEYRFEGDEWSRTPGNQLATDEEQQLLIGVPYDTPFFFRVVNDFGDGPLAGAEYAAETGPLPVEGIQPTILDADPTRWEPTGRYLLGSINTTDPGWHDGDYWMFAFDRQGRVVWATLAPGKRFCTYLQVSRSTGVDLLWDEVTYWTDWDDGAGSLAHRMKIDGTILETVAIPGANHAFTELPDGSIAWWAMAGDDGALMIRRPDGDVETLWTCLEFYLEQGITGSCLANTVFWHAEADTFLVSFAMRDFVAEIDHATGATVRTFGHVPDAYEFAPPESAFYVQHGTTYTDTGTLLLSTHVNDISDEGVVREYEIDETEQILHEVWSYGAGVGVTAFRGGEAHRLPGGNTLHNYGTTSRLKEIAPDGTVVWDVSWPVDRLLGRTIFVDDLYVFAP